MFLRIFVNKIFLIHLLRSWVNVIIKSRYILEKAGNSLQIAICDDIQKELEKIRVASWYGYCFSVNQRRICSNGVCTECHPLSAQAFLQEQFNEALDRAVKKTEAQDFLTLACVDGMYRVCVSEIMFIEPQTTITIEIFNGVKIMIPGRSSKEVQKLYMDFCRKEALEWADYTGFRDCSLRRCVMRLWSIIWQNTDIPRRNLWFIAVYLQLFLSVWWVMDM